MTPDFFESLKQDLEIVENSCVYTLPVVTWMMILQRLSPKGTLDIAVREMVQGNGRALLQPCKRVREDNISINTGGYSRARKKLPREAAQRITSRTFECLHEDSASLGDLRNRLYVIDGSSIRLPHAPAVVKAYPPAENQHGESHWPVMRVAVMHHVTTGLAMAPEFGPMYGSDAVSEQGLAETLIERLPPASILIGDRNFGVFSVMWHAHSRGHLVLARLTEARARRLAGSDLTVGMDQKLTWLPSRDDRRAHPALPEDTSVEGRLIVCQPAGAGELLYLFTTLDVPASEIAGLYKQRWNIETDLRSLKQEVRLHTINARSPNLIASELHIAVATYNLIRALMAQAASQIGTESRRLSFSRSQDAFWAFIGAVSHLDFSAHEKFEYHWKILMRSLQQSKLPQRHRPTAPRAVWPKTNIFPTKKVPRLD